MIDLVCFGILTSLLSLSVDSFPILSHREAQLLAPRPKQPRCRKRLRWNEFDETLFFRAVLRFGPGRWADINKSMALTFERSTVQLKDKWRSLVRDRDRFADLERMFGRAPREEDGSVQLCS